MRSAGILNIPSDRPGALELAKCARGTPRIANRLLKRVRDFATVAVSYTHLDVYKRQRYHVYQTEKRPVEQPALWLPQRNAANA